MGFTYRHEGSFPAVRGCADAVTTWIDFLQHVLHETEPFRDHVNVSKHVCSVDLQPDVMRLSQVKSSHIYLYSAFYNTDCIKAASQ